MATAAKKQTAKKVPRKASKKRAKRKLPKSATFVRQPQVPNFSEAAIYIADLCARESWIGNSYINGKPLKGSLNFAVTVLGAEPRLEEFINHVSDEGFLIVYATGLMNLAGIPGVNFKVPGSSITYENLDALIVAAELDSAVNTKRNITDIAQGINFLKNDCVQRYRDWSRTHNQVPQGNIARDLVKALSKELTIFDNNKYLGNQPALASRLLNFGFPELCVYNFSQPIQKGLKLNSKPDSGLDDYYELLDDGYRRNWNVLSKFSMPPSQAMSQVVWQRANNAGWWQRRVYDFALKLYFSESGMNYFPNFSPKVQENLFVKARAFP